MTYIFCSIYQYIFSTKRSYTTIQGVHCTLINILIFLPRKFFIKIEQIAKKNPNQTDPLTDSKWIPCCICFCGVPILQLGMLHPWDLINTPPVNVSSLSGYLEAQQSRVTQYLVAAIFILLYIIYILANSGFFKSFLYQGCVKSTFSCVFEDLKFKISENYNQNWWFPWSAQLAVSV